MSYTKREWATGNVVGAVDLNRIENGIEEAGSSGGGSLVVRPTTDGSYDKTWQEVCDAYEEGLPVYVQNYNERDFLCYLENTETGWYCFFYSPWNNDNITLFNNTSADAPLILQQTAL